MAKGTVTQRLNIYIDNTEAERALEKLRTRATKLETEIDDINRAGGNATKSMQRLASTRSQIKNLETSIKTGVNRSLRDMRGELSRVKRELDRATDPADIDRLNKRWQALKSETDEYRQALYKVNQQKKGLKGIFGGIGSNLKGALFFGGVSGAITAATGALIRFTRQSFQLALQAKGVERAFNRLNNPDLLKNLREATRGTVSDMELMKRAVSASNFKIPLNKLGLYLKFAQQRARDTGQSVDYLVESIITGLGRKSPLILDNLGISLAEIRSEMKKGATMAEAVGNIIERSFQKSGNNAVLLADKIDRVNAKMKNASVAFGNNIAKSFDFLDRTKKYWVWVIKNANVLLIQLNLISKVYEAIRGPQEQVISKGEKAAGETIAKAVGLGGLIKKSQFPMLSSMIGDTAETLEGLNTELTTLQGQLKKLPTDSKAFTETKVRIEALKKKIKELTASDSLASNTNKVKSDQEKLAADLEKINRDLSHFFDNEIQARLYAIQQKYEKERALAHGNAELLKKIEETKAREIALINQKYLEKTVASMQKARLTLEQLNSVQSVKPGDAKLAPPGSNYSKAITNTDLGNNSTNPESKLQKDFGNIMKYFHEAQSAYYIFDQFLANREQQELAEENRLYNKKITNLKRQLRLKIITQQDYNKKVAGLEKDLDKKRYEVQKKQFNRQKELQIAQTISNGAAAAVRLWVQPGFPEAIPLLAVVAALTAAKVGLIAAQKPPEYGRGGALDGPKHNSPSGGMPVTNPETGQVQAYMEGGEGILKASAMDDRRIYRVTGTPSQIASVLNASHGGVNWESGATLQPTWMQQAYRPINYDRIQPSLRRFAEGGRFDQSSTASAQSPEISEQMALMKEQNELLRQQVALLAMPTRAVVSLHDINAEQARLQRIQEDATMRR